jgi:TPR repeat protein
VNANVNLSAHYTTLSAHQGCRAGQVAYGLALVLEYGVAQKFSKADRLFRKCSGTGYAGCQFMYSLYLQIGNGMSQNLTKRRKYIKLSAHQ